MQNPYEKYRQQSVMTMTQGDMIFLLYSELGDRLGKGLICLENKDYEGCNTAFKKSAGNSDASHCDTGSQI